MKLSRGVYLEAFLSFQKRVLYASPADWLVDFGSGLLTGDMGVDTEPEANEEFPMLHIHEVQHSTDSECQDGSVRCVVLKAFKDVPMQRVSMEWSLVDPQKHSWKAMSLAEQNELNNHLTRALGSSYMLHRGAPCHAEGYCASGLVCRGVCHLQELDTSDCGENCEELNRIFKHMSLIVTSSGGGGHLVAAKNLQQELLEEHEQRLQRGHELLAQSKHLLSKDLRVAVERALEELLLQPPVQLVDLMKSPCTNFGLIPLGDFMSEEWNRKQRAGDIKGLKQLVKKQPWTQVFFGKQCEAYMAEVFAGKNAYEVPPTQIYTVQPLLLESLLAAAPPVSVELFMTDLPTAEAVHFFQPLQRMREKLRGGWKDKLILHSLPAALGGADELERLSGVPQRMTKLEKFMPVNQAFKRPHGLPSPKELVALKLKAQLPLEERFLRKLGNPLVIQEHDEVILVMLGSQPTASAVKAYAKESLKLPLPAQKRYVLLACGKPTVEDYAELYKEVVAMASESHGVPHTVLVPFTGQDAKEMLGRADVTITRSGGLTAGELLALRSRPSDQKRMLLHVEPVESAEATRAMAKALAIRLAAQRPRHEVLRQAFRDGMLEGMVPWEAGNARYLVTAAGADVVTPETVVKVMAGEEAEPFEVDWQLLLRLKGFGADEIAFATSAHECDSRAVCERGLTDLPVQEDLVDKGCRRELQRFSDPLASGFRQGLNFFGGNDGLAALAKLGDKVFQYESGRFSNSHHCHGANFLVRQRWAAANLDSLAASAVEACGARKAECGDFVILELPR